MQKTKLKELIFESICEYYQERYRQHLLKEDQDKNDNMVFGEGGAVLPDSLEQILAKFPTLKHCLIRLQTENFADFVSGIDWISPKPTEFRINLKNGQNFTLKWMGKDFEATISGKKYYLGQLVDFQRALEKLSILYQEGPVAPEEEGGAGPESGDRDFGGGGSGGNFPGEEGGAGPEEAPEEPVPEGGEEESKDNVEDLNVDFETDDTL